ncbi:MAG: hypothetical protein A3K19_31630 [Lentisphaerae bacterium RIFOXYB12_FULL_65_16]|nr:MAG: hypothetical protein A3K18_10410 [Lentisphaerae bacterium RIFOXYA12_64_32]OGV88655.1 MAG: hypothetical protein A3K19_31630 [Lentisphaerae bacterium RIFOXYB12_FULL_65_16]
MPTSTEKRVSRAWRWPACVAVSSLLVLACPALWAADAPGPEQPFPAAIARALCDAGVQLLLTVPATGASEIHDRYHELPGRPAKVYSFHEEVAYTVAHGAALNGCRSAVAFKPHGAAKAANSIIDSLSCGTNAALVLIVVDDPTGRHSDNIMDVPALLKGLRLPVVVMKPDAPALAIADAVRQSEALRLPVAVLVNDEDFARTVPTAAPLPPPAAPPPYTRDICQHLLCPVLTGYQEDVLRRKLAGADFSAVPRPSLPIVPDQLPPRYRDKARTYVPLFQTFREVVRPKAVFVAGDTGTSTLFAFPPFDCVDACTYYGGSLPLAIGALLAGKSGVWAVTGDFAFIAAGHLGLIEARSRGLPLKVLIVRNDVAGATGGQSIAPGLLDTILAGYSDAMVAVDGTDPAAVRKALETAQASDRLAIVVARIPYP